MTGLRRPVVASEIKVDRDSQAVVPCPEDGPDLRVLPSSVDIPVAGDWTGTGTAKIGVFRNGQWFLDLNGNGAWDGCGTDVCYASFGMAADKPVIGNW